MTGHEARGLAAGDRVAYEGDSDDLGMVAATFRLGVTVRWDRHWRLPTPLRFDDCHAIERAEGVVA